MSAFGAKPTLAGPHRPVGFYVPRFRNTKGGPKSKDFLRGYGYEGDTQVDFIGVRRFWRIVQEVVTRGTSADRCDRLRRGTLALGQLR